MRRREFLASAAAAMTAAGSPTLWAQAQTPAKAKQSTLDRIAIMTLNFQRILKVPDVQDSPERTLDLFDIGEMIADKYGVHKVEFQHYHIASTEPSYLKELRSRLEKAKSRATQINLEFSGLNMSAPRLRDRLMAIDLTKAWVDHAVLMGAQRVMVNQGAQGGADSGHADAREQGLRHSCAQGDGGLRAVQGNHRFGRDARRGRRRPRSGKRSGRRGAGRRSDWRGSCRTGRRGSRALLPPHRRHRPLPRCRRLRSGRCSSKS